MTVADETGWEFDTLKRVYANIGLDKNGETTLVAWKIVQPSPRSTGLRAEEIREEKLTFPVQPWDGKRFTIRAVMRYFVTPPTQAGFAPEPEAAEMAQAILTIRGKPRTTESSQGLRGAPPWPRSLSSPHSHAGRSVVRGKRPS